MEHKKDYKINLDILTKAIDMNIKIHPHNGVSIFEYPEISWNLIPFPEQKGEPFNSDNLATVNRHNFLKDKKFKDAKEEAERRWGTPGVVRDIAWRLHFALWAFGLAYKKDEIPGIYIEAGTGKGYMAAAICQFYFKGKESNNNFYLFDNFSKHLEINGIIQKSPAEFAYTDDALEVKEYFSRYKNIEIICGELPNSLDILRGEPIHFLHLDLNNPIVEKKVLNSLLPLFKSGSVILLDDYGGPRGEPQAKVHEEFANKNKKQILNSPTGQGLIIW